MEVVQQYHRCQQQDEMEVVQQGVEDRHEPQCAAVR